MMILLWNTKNIRFTLLCKSLFIVVNKDAVGNIEVSGAFNVEMDKNAPGKKIEVTVFFNLDVR